MTIKDLLEQASAKIGRKEARILLAHYLQKDQIWLITHENEPCDASAYMQLVMRRYSHEPIEYITGSANFYSRDFYVDSRVLIPRPETELLIDEALALCRGLKAPKIVEIGTGSGIISILLALLIDDAKITAIDISQDALEVAQINAQKHGVAGRIEFLQSDLLEQYNETKFDLLISNPPYIALAEPLHVGLSYEPQKALFGGNRGDEMLQKIIDIYTKRDIKYLTCEMGYDQRENLSKYLQEFGLDARFYKDLAGLDRGFVIEGTKAL